MKHNTPLTPEQQELAARQYKEIEKYLWRKKLDASEWYDVAAFGYLRAVRLYTERPDLRRYAFSTIAGRSMDSEIGKERKKQRRRIQALSLDAELTEDGFTLYDAVGLPDFAADEPGTSSVCSDLVPLLQELTDHQRAILTLKSNGYTRSQIAEVMGISPKAADSAVERGRQKLRRTKEQYSNLEVAI